jgi:hypothetical protein
MRGDLWTLQHGRATAWRHWVAGLDMIASHLNTGKIGDVIVAGAGPLTLFLARVPFLGIAIGWHFDFLLWLALRLGWDSRLIFGCRNPQVG